MSDQYSDVAWGIENMFLVRNGEPIGTLYGMWKMAFMTMRPKSVQIRCIEMRRTSKVKSMVGEVKYKNLDDDLY